MMGHTTIANNFNAKDKGMEIKDIATKYGLMYKEYKVNTSDGFILTLMEIFKNGISADAQVVLLQHGLFQSGSSWTTIGADSPPFYLANKGFRVFIGNNRGCIYSREHTKYKPTKSDSIKNENAYFDYSFYELGKFDAPA